MINDGDDSDVSNHYGRATAALVNDVYEQGAQRAVLLMRHSARTFDRDIHDLLNQLTDHGRTLCGALGEALPKDVVVRGYASPAERCMETAQLVIAAHQAAGGEGMRTRAVEALGVFYALDQRKMWKGLSQAEGLAAYVQQWFDGDVPVDAMMPAELAAKMVLRALLGKLSSPVSAETDGAVRHLDLCVSHDLTVFTVRHGAGLEPVDGPAVEFLDGLILFARDGKCWLRSQHGGEVEVSV